ncbi:MAG: cysteine hydrolase family protein [Omnitrophica WOR_2 bacterium]
MSQSAFAQSAPFLNYLAEWQANLPEIALKDIVGDDPQKAAIFSVDVTNGFCYEGNLASPRVKGIIDPIVKLFRQAYGAGVRNFVLIQDTHEPEAVEFGQFPPHCVRGTKESQAVPEIQSLPFFSEMVTLEKNSISTSLDTGMDAWLESHPEVDAFIAVGDCTDLCTYQMAMDLRLKANARQIRRRVIVPADAVDTYDMPVEAARSLGAMPHDADLLHAIFLYHMALNGIEVVKCIR